MSWQDIISAVALLTPEGLLKLQTLIVERASVATFQDIETRFRKEHVPVYLIARENTPYCNAAFIKPGSGDPAKYFLFVSRRPEMAAMKEVLLESRSYDDNFAKLAHTGILTVDRNSHTDMDSITLMALLQRIRLTTHGMQVLHDYSLSGFNNR